MAIFCSFKTATNSDVQELNRRKNKHCQINLPVSKQLACSSLSVVGSKKSLE